MGSRNFVAPAFEWDDEWRNLTTGWTPHTCRPAELDSSGPLNPLRSLAYALLAERCLACFRGASTRTAIRVHAEAYRAEQTLRPRIRAAPPTTPDMSQWWS